MPNSGNSTTNMRQPPAVDGDHTLGCPECKVTATVDPHGMVTLFLSRQMAGALLEHVHDQRTSHDGDGLVDLRIILKEQSYRQLAANVGRLTSDEFDGEFGAVHVMVAKPPEIAVSVVMNERQINGLDERSTRDLEKDGDVYAWEFGVSQNGVHMLEQQLVAAINGADDPLDHVEVPDDAE